MGSETDFRGVGGTEREIHPRKNAVQSELALFLVMLAVAEPEAEPHHVRDLFKLHWERGVEMMVDHMGDLDWLEYLANHLGVVE